MAARHEEQGSYHKGEVTTVLLSVVYTPIHAEFSNRWIWHSIQDKNIKYKISSSNIKYQVQNRILTSFEVQQNIILQLGVLHGRDMLAIFCKEDVNYKLEMMHMHMRNYSLLV